MKKVLCIKLGMKSTIPPEIYIKNALEDGFDSQGVMKQSAKAVFLSKDFDKACFLILEIVARRGPTLKYGITNSIARLTRAQVEYRIKNVLIPFGFVTEHTSNTTHRKIKNAFGKKLEVKPKLISLTTKGVMASLHRVPFEDIIQFNDYFGIIKTKIVNETISFLAFQHIKYSILIYLLNKQNRGSNLTHENIEIDYPQFMELLPMKDPEKGTNFTDMKLTKTVHEVRKRWYALSHLIDVEKHNNFGWNQIIIKNWITVIGKISKDMEFDEVDAIWQTRKEKRDYPIKNLDVTKFAQELGGKFKLEYKYQTYFVGP